jgi:RNA polymerase sigma-70 factor (ECF subfamily)
MPVASARRASDIERSDADLVATIAAGDLSDLGHLFDRYVEDVRRLFTRLGVPACDLDDLVQQTFLEIPRASVSFRAGAPVRPWLFGLATILARRRRRSVSRMLARLQRWALEPRPAGSPTPAEQLEQTSEAHRAWTALEKISSKKREAFVLVALEGMSCVEAASTLGIPVATVWTRIHYARIELRDLLAASEGEG